MAENSNYKTIIRNDAVM